MSLTKLIINKIQKLPAEKQHTQYGVVSGIIGISCNLLLCILKFVLGALTGAVSVTADAVNNLSDAAVNIVTIAGAKLAEKPVDKEHPFGHGRAEYISALLVALSVFLMSFELGKSAVGKILHPEAVQFSPVYLIVLAIAIGIKLWMAYINRRLYTASGNLNLKAVMRDSLNDCLATAATAAALVLSGVFHIRWADGVIGLAVAVFVCCSGISIVKEILGPLLGQAPPKELTDRIYDIILQNEMVLGVHDLIVHYYGPHRVIASAHAEVPCDVALTTVHEVIDSAEQAVEHELGVSICLHVDPVDADDGERDKYKTLTEILLGEYNSTFTFHDFRLRSKNGKKCLSFDLVIPFDDDGNKEQILRDIEAIYQKQLPETELHINMEHSYI